MTQIRLEQIRGGADLLTQAQADLLYAALTHGHVDLLTQAQADLLYAALVHGHVEDDIADLTHSAVALRGVSIADVTPEAGQLLQLVDGQWTPVTVETGGASALDDLSDVDASSPIDGQVLAWSDTGSAWTPVTVETGGASALDDLSDVDASSPIDGQVLAWSASAEKWAPVTVEGGTGGGSGVVLGAFDFQPEFAGAIIVPSVAQNGTLQLYDDVAARLNAYAWTSSLESEQTVDIVLRWRVPAGFDAWTSALGVMSRVSVILSTAAVQVVEFLDTAGVNVITSTTRRYETWVEDSLAITGGTWTPGGICTLRFRLYGKVGEVAYLGPVRLAYRLVFE